MRSSPSMPETGLEPALPEGNQPLKPSPITAEGQRKLICGFLHVRVRCRNCKELIWVAFDNPDKYDFVCYTCTEANLQPSTRGGTRLHWREEEEEKEFS